MINKVLGYSVESLQKVFNQLRGTAEDKSCYWFIVAVDGVEIVPMTDELNRFYDFMHYDLSKSEVLLFRLYHAPDRLAYSFKFFIQAYREHKANMERKCIRLEIQNELLAAENKELKQAARKHKRSQLYEKPKGIKAIDANDCLVLFVPKKEIDEVLTEQLKTQRAGILQLEKVERFFHRFVFPNKT